MERKRKILKMPNMKPYVIEVYLVETSTKHCFVQYHYHLISNALY